jgi:hydrogenase maturation factor
MDFVPEAVVGDYVMVHAGFAISRVNSGKGIRTH